MVLNLSRLNSSKLFAEVAFFDDVKRIILVRGLLPHLLVWCLTNRFVADTVFLKLQSHSTT